MTDVYLPLLLTAMMLAAGAHWFVQSSFLRYSRMPLATGRSGSEVARSMLYGEGLYSVAIEVSRGHLTDHYDIRANVIRLSESVHNGRSVAAASVAAHEAGHAIQHAQGFLPARLRKVFVPTVGVRASLALPLILVGVLAGAGGLIWAGVILTAVAVLFQVVSLPVELDASRRAMVALSIGNILPHEQLRGAKTVLMAATLTYVAALLVAVLQLTLFVQLATQ